MGHGSKTRAKDASVSMKQGGVRYRLAVAGDRPSFWSRLGRSARRPPASGDAIPLTEIESGDVTGMTDVSSAELLEELNAKRRAPSRWPFAALSLLIALPLSALDLAVAWLGLVAAAAFTVWVHRQDRLAKTMLLVYDFDRKIEEAYRLLNSSAAAMAACRAVWHVEAEGGVKDPKYRAGARAVVRRRRTFIKKSRPRHVAANIETTAIGVGRQTLYFFPDRLLVLDKGAFGAVTYRDLEVRVSQVEFVESGKPPIDAQVAGRTWRYVNREGSPDRRFRENRELPVCLYEQIHFASPSGLNERIQLSRVGAGEDFAKALARLSHRIGLAERARVASGDSAPPA